MGRERWTEKVWKMQTDVSQPYSGIRVSTFSNTDEPEEIIPSEINQLPKDYLTTVKHFFIFCYFFFPV